MKKLYNRNKELEVFHTDSMNLTQPKRQTMKTVSSFLDNVGKQKDNTNSNLFPRVSID